MEKKQFTVKRFKIETTTLHNKFFAIREGKENRIVRATTAEEPVLAMQSGRGSNARKAKIKIVKVAESHGMEGTGLQIG